MRDLSRRDLLVTLGAALAASRSIGAQTEPAPANDKNATTLRGAFMILNTPFTADGAVDWDDLAREAQFVDRAGAQGIVWPQGSSSVGVLTKDERLRGMETLARAVRGRRVALVLGVQGKDTAEMLAYAERAEALAPDAVIAMPPTSATSLDDYWSYFRALGKATRRPVFLQTSGGARTLVPPTDMIVGLAREFPNFGYVKEESEPLVERLVAELAHRDVMKGIFCANFGANWLFTMRLGVDGVVTGNAMYADLFARMWDLHERKKDDELRDAYSRFLLMRNLSELVPGADLYVMKRRGIFKTTFVRTRQPDAQGRAGAAERTFSPAARAEIEYRYAALAPYLDSRL